MTIVIKEIHVKARIEKDKTDASLSEQTINQLKQSIVSEIRESNRRSSDWKKER